MKIMVASDIHGSAFYCRQMIERFREEKADRLLILGDILYHGPRNDLPKEYAPKEVIPMLDEIKDSIFCVKGNCDGDVDQMVLDFPILAEYSVFLIEKRLVYVTHGHKLNLKNLPPLRKGDILLHGHTHVPAWEEFGDENLYLNPGSVSIPKNDSRHSYMIIEDNKIYWKDLQGEIYHTCEI